MKVPFISFEKRNQEIKTEVLLEFEKFFDSQYYVLGESTTSFENSFSLFNQTKHAIGVSNGLDALILSLKALNIKPGDQVIVPSNTYIASVLAITNCNAIPLFVEPRIDTYNINPELIEELITEKTKAIMPVHLYGQACEMDKILDISKKYNLSIVEDNAQAHGATFNGKPTGSFGHVNATSFYPSKNLGALGEAGAVTTNDDELATKVRTLRNYGSLKRYHNDMIGSNYRIDEFEAAYLNLALKRLEKWNEYRDKVASKYNEDLKEVGDIKLSKLAQNATTVNHQFVIRTNYRDELKAYLEKNGISTVIHYPIPPHLQKCYQDLGFKKGSFPIAENIAESILSLPIYYGMEEEKTAYVISKVKEFYYHVL